MKMNRLTTLQIFIESARKCCANAERLLSDAQMVEFEKPKATHYFLSVIAQEETAKAFLLYLVSIEAITWTPFLLRATRDRIYQSRCLFDEDTMAHSSFELRTN
jgi:hypothetical protein